MNGLSPIAILLFGIALGACLPLTISALRVWLRRKWFRPRLLHLDAPPPQSDDAA